jgi:hypothetical protein
MKDSEIEHLLGCYSIESPRPEWIEQFQHQIAKKESSPGLIKSLVVGLTTLAVTLGSARYAYQSLREVPSAQLATPPAKPVGGFMPDQFPQTVVKLPVVPFMSYRTANCQEIKERRKQALQQPALQGLVAKNYDANKARLMDNATDGKPWRQLDRTFFRDPTLDGKNVPQVAIDSVVLENPFLLGHLSYSYYRLTLDGFVNDPKTFIERCQQELTPTVLSLDGKNRCLQVKYQIRHRENYATLASRLAGHARRAEYRLVLANAYDLGLDYCVLNSAESQGFDESQGRFDNVRKTAMYCTTGMESLVNEEMTQIRYNGSMCPNLTLDSLPAKLSIGLWKESPKDIKAKPDLRLEIEITGTGEVEPNHSYLKEKSSP